MAFELWPNSNNIVPALPGLGPVPPREINLRNEFHTILHGNGVEPQRGHWVIYRRMDISTTSKYYDPVTGVGKGGPMWEYKDELWMCRATVMRVRQAIIAAEMEADPGILNTPFHLFYFEHDLNPKPDDEIYEIYCDDHSVKPKNVKPPYKERFNIKLIQPNRDLSGRIEFYTIAALGENTKW